MRSIENDRELNPVSQNPFATEISLYEKNRSAGDIPVAVSVPDFYPVAFPNIGHQIIEKRVNDMQDYFAYRCYLSTDYKILRESQIPSELVLISMSYEGSYIRALRVLDQLGIPLEANKRTEEDPVVVFGGRAVSINPLPLFDTADVIGIGDGEELIVEICDAFRAARTCRSKLFELLNGKRGIVIPSRYHVETEGGYLKTWEPKNAPLDIEPNRGSSFPHSWYLSSETDYNDIGYYEGQTFFSMEIVKACASKCLFCAEGFNNGRMRFTDDTENITKLGSWAKDKGADLVKLFFPANSTVETTKNIVRSLLDLGLQPRVGSAKAEKIDREYIEFVGKSGQEKIAFAPETGDYELRKKLGKPGMTNEVLDTVITNALEAGIPNVDFYFIMNLPGETPESFQRTVDLIGHFRDLTRRLGMKGRMRMSAPNFFPKAWTPFQYAPSGDINLYNDKIHMIEAVHGDGVKVSNMQGNVDLLSQNIMSRGGNEVGSLLRRVYERQKEREAHTGQFTPDTFEDWRVALQELGLSEEQYFSAKEGDLPLPWHHIRMHNSVDSLHKAWEVFKGRTIPLPVI